MVKKLLKSLRKNNIRTSPKAAFDTLKGRIATAVSAAFAFVIALSWNDAIKDWVTGLINLRHF